MKITMLTTAAGPEGSYEAGKTYEVGMDIPNKLAEAFVKGNYARMVGKPAAVAAPTAAAPAAVETAVVEPEVEKAVKIPVKKAIAKKPARK